MKRPIARTDKAATKLTSHVPIQREVAPIIEPTKHLREGWEAAFREMAANGDDVLLDADEWPPTDFERNEWTW